MRNPSHQRSPSQQVSSICTLEKRKRAYHSRVYLTLYGEGNDNPLQYSCLTNPTDGGAWKAAVHGVARSWTRLRDFTFTFHFHALEKEMASHSSVLAWRIPGTGNLVGCRLWGRTESDMTEVTQQQQQQLPLYKAIPFYTIMTTILCY